MVIMLVRIGMKNKYKHSVRKKYPRKIEQERARRTIHFLLVDELRVEGHHVHVAELGDHLKFKIDRGIGSMAANEFSNVRLQTLHGSL